MNSARLVFAIISTVLTALLIVHMCSNPVLGAHGPEPITPDTVLIMVGYMLAATAIAWRCVRQDRDQ